MQKMADLFDLFGEVSIDDLYRTLFGSEVEEPRRARQHLGMYFTRFRKATGKRIVAGQKNLTYKLEG